MSDTNMILFFKRLEFYSNIPSFLRARNFHFKEIFISISFFQMEAESENMFWGIR